MVRPRGLPTRAYLGVSFALRPETAVSQNSMIARIHGMQRGMQLNEFYASPHLPRRPGPPRHVFRETARVRFCAATAQTASTCAEGPLPTVAHGPGCRRPCSSRLAVASFARNRARVLGWRVGRDPARKRNKII